MIMTQQVCKWEDSRYDLAISIGKNKGNQLHMGYSDTLMKCPEGCDIQGVYIDRFHCRTASGKHETPCKRYF